MDIGTAFQPVLASTLEGQALESVAGPASAIKSVVFCSGKVYYDLVAGSGSSTRPPGSVAVIRIEELAPFPAKRIKDLLQTK